MNKEQEKLINDNINFAYWLSHKWAKTQSTLDVDELISISLFALTKAAISYKSGKSQFNTYARFCIENEFKNALKKQKKYGIEIEETAVDCTSYTDDIDTSILIASAIKPLSPLCQNIFMDFYQKKLTQYEIADKYKISQTQVCCILKKAKKIVIEKLQN